MSRERVQRVFQGHLESPSGSDAEPRHSLRLVSACLTRATVCREEPWAAEKGLMRNFLRRHHHGASLSARTRRIPTNKLYNDDWNNFAPSFGLSWSLPWFGKDKTVLRAGYGWSYTRQRSEERVRQYRRDRGFAAGHVRRFRRSQGIFYTQAGYLSLANFTLPIPQQFAPLQPDPLDGQRSNAFQMYASQSPEPLHSKLQPRNSAGTRHGI